MQQLRPAALPAQADHAPAGAGPAPCGCNSASPRVPAPLAGGVQCLGQAGTFRFGQRPAAAEQSRSPVCGGGGEVGAAPAPGLQGSSASTMGSSAAHRVLPCPLGQLSHNPFCRCSKGFVNSTPVRAPRGSQSSPAGRSAGAISTSRSAWVSSPTSPGAAGNSPSASPSTNT